MEPRSLYEVPGEIRRGGTLKAWLLISEDDMRALHSNINFAGVCLIEAHVEIELHDHPEEEIFYFTSGIGAVTVEGKTYSASTDLHISGFGNKRSRLSNSQKIIDEYTVGSQVKVYYDAQNPKISYLRIGPFWSDYVKLATGLLLFALGSYYLLTNLFIKIKD